LGNAGRRRTILLRAESVRAGYGRVEVLHGLSAQIDTGERVGIFGPNGHGKTTFLRTLSGLIRPAAGRITFAGHEIAGRAPRQIVALGLIHVPQSSSLFPRISVNDNLMLGAYAAHAWQCRAEGLEQVYDLFPGLRSRARQRAGTLSGGERQMVAIGMGLMGRPKLLILDEPTLGLAPKIRELLSQAMSEIAATGVPMLVVDQDLEFLTGFADRLYLVERGQVVQEIDGEHGISDQQILEMYFGSAAR
jgi:branched-chain amino acid transport system ATP-binding protein